MADELYTIKIDRQRSLVRLTLFGLWDVAAVDRYAAAAQAAFSTLTKAGTPLDRCKVLIDLRQHGVQPREVTERIQIWLKKALSGGALHAVLVSESLLQGMQARRVGTLLDAEFFANEVMALDWLSRPRQPALAAS